jgi:hypothetical protein
LVLPAFRVAALLFWGSNTLAGPWVLQQHAKTPAAVVVCVMGVCLPTLRAFVPKWLECNEQVRTVNEKFTL